MLPLANSTMTKRKGAFIEITVPELAGRGWIARGGLGAGLMIATAEGFVAASVFLTGVWAQPAKKSIVVIATKNGRMGGLKGNCLQSSIAHEAPNLLPAFVPIDPALGPGIAGQDFASGFDEALHFGDFRSNCFFVASF